MALIQCSECGQQISDKAEFCPHCGLPMKPKTTRHFRILIGGISENNFSIWLKVIAAITLVGGVIAAAFGANQQVTYGYSTRNVFNTTYFFSTLVTYIESAFILWSVGKIVQMIHETHEMVAGIHLEEREQDESKPQRSNSRPGSSSLSSKKIAPLSSSVDAGPQFAICPNCGKRSSINLVKIKRQCPYCKYQGSGSWEFVDS